MAWRGGDWVLYVSGDGAGSDPLSTAELTLRREDTDPPLRTDGSDCTITFTSTTLTHLAGHADCTGLVWEDPMSDSMDLPVPSGSPATDHPLFDATIVFDATP